MRPSSAAATPPSTTAFALLLRRLHFYIGVFIGPFLLVAALSGSAYVLTPQLESYLYASALHADSTGKPLPLVEQIRIAEKVVDSASVLSAVRPAPRSGDTTRVMFSVPGYGPSESRAIFIDPVSGQVKGDLKVYGTSGVLPLRTWLDQFHRGLLLGDVGRFYSELAASWLWVAALGGLYLWATRRGSRKTLARVHASVGLVLFLGLVFFSATGLTWSQLAGENIGVFRKQFGWSTPSVSTQLNGPAHAVTDEHAMHHMAHDAGAAHGFDPVLFDHIMHAARAAGIDAGKIEIRPAANRNSAWVVSEIDRSWPTQVDSVAIDPASLQVVDHVQFSQYPIAAKLTRWGIDAHMGVLFGLANQLILLTTGLGLALMVCLGYMVWWRRRPTRGVQPTLIDAWQAFKPMSRVALVLLGVLLGIALPLLGASLLMFLLFDLLATRRRRR